MLLNVKPSMLAVLLVELVLNTFTQAVSECLCKAYNMNQVAGFSRRRMKYTKIERVKLQKLCMRNRTEIFE